MLETWVWPLGCEDLLEKETVTHSDILAWRITRTEEPGGLQSVGSQRVGHDWALTYAHRSENVQYATREEQRAITNSLTDYVKAFDCVDHKQLWKIHLKNGNTRLSYLSPEKPEKPVKQQNQTWNNGLAVNWEFKWSLCLFNLYAEYIKQNAVLDE